MHGRRAIPEVLLPHLGAAYNVALWLIQNEREARAIVEEAYAEAGRDLKDSVQPMPESGSLKLS
ncbi:MAG: hypothetical protein C5B58_13960 [Acidobacteria bacterium]|nr:MAG: hypothetical protein C5B58_13960 [Acidobacteriota bacterium]